MRCYSNLSQASLKNVKFIFIYEIFFQMSPSLIHVSLWVQWTLPKLSFNIFGNDNGSDLRITTELEDWSASFDYQNGHFKAQCKVGNLSITHYKLG